MILHFEIDQEVNNCEDCIFNYMEPEFGELECTLSWASSRLRGEYICSNTPEAGIPEWCPCAKVEEE